MRASCWVSVLPPSASDRLRTSRTAARVSPMGSMPGVRIEPAVLYGDDGVLEIGGDLIQGDVAPLFIEPEPWFRVGAVENRVADAFSKVVDRAGRSGHQSQRRRAATMACDGRTAKSSAISGPTSTAVNIFHIRNSKMRLTASIRTLSRLLEGGKERPNAALAPTRSSSFACQRRHQRLVLRGRRLIDSVAFIIMPTVKTSAHERHHVYRHLHRRSAPPSWPIDRC